MRLLTQDGVWRTGTIDCAGGKVDIEENGKRKELRNVMRIQSNGRALTTPGDSGTLIYAAANPHVQPGGLEVLPVYGMAVGNVDLRDGSSFTVANRLCDVLPAIGDRKATGLFRGYRDLHLCGIACEWQQPESGFYSG